MGDVRTPLLLMFGAVVLVLGIGCANVASLLLARGMEREREFAIRSALGAGRARLVRQLVAESLMLSAIAAAVRRRARPVGHRGHRRAGAGSGVVRLHEASIDGRALLIAAALTTLTAVGFGLLPALQFSRPGHDPMRERTAGTTRRGFRRGLVAAEVAFALVLLTGAGLLIRSFNRLTAVDPGFSPAGVVELQVFVYERHVTPERTRSLLCRDDRPHSRASGRARRPVRCRRCRLPSRTSTSRARSTSSGVRRAASGSARRLRHDCDPRLLRGDADSAARGAVARGPGRRARADGRAGQRLAPAARMAGRGRGRPSGSACGGRAGGSKRRSSAWSARSATTVSTASRGRKCSCRWRSYPSAR